MSQSIITYIRQIQEHLATVIEDQTLRTQYAWWLLEHATGATKAHLLTTPIIITPEQHQWIAQSLHEICQQHKPIAYVLGTVPFGPLTIKVRPPILIPRPETEQWVYELLMRITQAGIKKLTILDLCTGSGCIALLCASLLPQASVYAVDISSDALHLATENKKLLAIQNVTFMQSNLFEQLENIKFDLILSNPPYIGIHEPLDPSVTAWEDPQALYAPDDGYAIIKQIIAQAPHFLKPNRQLEQHQINQLYIEIGWQQMGQVTKMMQKEGYVAITSIKDVSEKERVVSGSIIHETDTSLS